MAAAVGLGAAISAGCVGPLGAHATPPPLPAADLPVDGSGWRGTFIVGLGQTVRTGPGGGSPSRNVLAEVGHNSDGTLFKAVGIGWTTVNVYQRRDCGPECNELQPLSFNVVVVSPTELQSGIMISDQSAPWNTLSTYGGIIHLRQGQRLSIAFHNRPSLRPFTRVVESDPAVIVPEGTAIQSADGIRASFRAGRVGRSEVWAAGDDCLSSGCTAQHPVFTFDDAS